MIPATAHFIWFGRDFPWIYGLALRSAALRGDFSSVVLHHSDELEATPGWQLAMETPKVKARRLDPEALLSATPELGERLVTLYRRLDEPAGKANMVRAALLFQEGGVYLDTDTVTVRSMRPLLDAGAFCGVEHLALPSSLVRSRNPLLWAKAGVLLALRDGLRRLPAGYRAFPVAAPLYSRAPNNAVLASAPEHPFLRGLLEGMVNTPKERQRVRYALGTHLLTDTVKSWRASHVDEPPDLALVVHPPAVFYPLCPEISEHWFRRTNSAEPKLALKERTRVVHWYASVRTREVVPKVDAAYVRNHAAEQLFSALALPFLPQAC
jgi:hypothetical protein